MGKVPPPKGDRRPAGHRFRRFWSSVLPRAVVCAAVLWALPAGASEPAVHEKTLENGLKILVLENHRAPTATFQIWYRVGSRDEPMGRSGLSHLLEHMMFKGTAENGPKTFSQSIRRVGGVDNAFTSREYTGYFQLLAADQITLPMELEADRMINLRLRTEDVLAERDVVMEERRMRSVDDPQSQVFEEVVAAAFKSHPYRRPVVGWMEDLRRIVPADLARHYKKYYAPNNAVVVIVGDVDPQETFRQVERYFGTIPPSPDLPERDSLGDSPQNGPRRIVVRREAELPYILRVYKVPSEPEKEAYALDVLSSILAGGRSARLFDRLVYERQLALSAWAGYDGMMKDPFLFYIGGTAAPDHTWEELEAALDGEVARVRESLVEDEELMRAKNQVAADFVFQQDSIYMQARMLGSYEMVGNWRFMDEYLEGVQQVTAEDVRGVARKYLVEDHSTTGVLIPVNAPESEETTRGEHSSSGERM